jgi:hypothetical protein
MRRATSNTRLVDVSISNRAYSPMQTLLASGNKSSLTFGESVYKRIIRVNTSPQPKFEGFPYSRNRGTVSPNPKLLFPAFKYSEEQPSRKSEQRTVSFYESLQNGQLSSPSASLIARLRSPPVKIRERIPYDSIFTSADTCSSMCDKLSNPKANDGKPVGYQSQMIHTSAARYCVTSGGGISDQRMPAGRSLFQNYGLRSPGIVTPKRRGEALDGRLVTPICSLNRVQTIKVKLQEYLQDLNTTKSLVSPQDAVVLAKPVIEIVKKPMTIINDQLTEDSSKCGSPESNTNNQPGALKELLQNPKQAGTELTISQFRQLESTLAVEARKSCLRTSNTSRKGLSLELDSLDKGLSKEKLKRSVSFSENVVMFIYQA